MINQLIEPTDLENRARAGVAQFIAEAITTPAEGWTYADPERNLIDLILVIAGGSPNRLHRICRLAWAFHKAEGIKHWEAIHRAKATIDNAP